MRALTDAEVAVLTAMIQHAPPDIAPESVTEERRAKWLGQVPRVSVARECGCGTCASIEFALDGVPVAQAWSDEALFAYDVWQDALVFVHIINDVIRELEVAPVQDTVVITPNPDALDFSGWSEP